MMDETDFKTEIEEKPERKDADDADIQDDTLISNEHSYNLSWAESNRKLHMCQRCGKLFQTIKRLKLHLWDHQRRDCNTRPQFICGACNKVFYNNCAFARHARTHTGEKPHQCETCGKSFADPSYFKFHQRLHMEPTPWKCSVCDAGFRKERALHRHNIRAHFEGKSLPKCRFCGNVFSRSDSVTIHIKTIHADEIGEIPYRCKICRVSFGNSIAAINKHVCNKRSQGVQTVLEEDSKMIHKIDHCYSEKLCPIPPGVGHSVAQSNRNNIYSCHMCEKVFTDATSLRLHQENHVTPISDISETALLSAGLMTQVKVKEMLQTSRTDNKNTNDLHENLDISKGDKCENMESPNVEEIDYFIAEKLNHCQSFDDDEDEMPDIVDTDKVEMHGNQDTDREGLSGNGFTNANETYGEFDSDIDCTDDNVEASIDNSEVYKKCVEKEANRHEKQQEETVTIRRIVDQDKSELCKSNGKNEELVVNESFNANKVRIQKNVKTDKAKISKDSDNDYADEIYSGADTVNGDILKNQVTVKDEFEKDEADISENIDATKAETGENLEVCEDVDGVEEGAVENLDTDKVMACVKIEAESLHTDELVACENCSDVKIESCEPQDTELSKVHANVSTESQKDMPSECHSNKRDKVSDIIANFMKDKWASQVSLFDHSYFLGHSLIVNPYRCPIFSATPIVNTKKPCSQQGSNNLKQDKHSKLKEIFRKRAPSEQEDDILADPLPEFQDANSSIKNVSSKQEHIAKKLQVNKDAKLASAGQLIEVDYRGMQKKDTIELVSDKLINDNNTCSDDSKFSQLSRSTAAPKVSKNLVKEVRQTVKEVRQTVQLSGQLDTNKLSPQTIKKTVKHPNQLHTNKQSPQKTTKTVTHLNNSNTNELSNHKTNETAKLPKQFDELSPQDFERVSSHLRYNKNKQILLQCNICQKVFKWAVNLINHLKVHANICEICGKAFPAPSKLRHHQRIHSDDKSYKTLVCESCGKAFESKFKLNLHQRTHSGEKPFTCETCGKSFSDPSYFKFHQRIHLDVKNYQCSHCGKKFVSTSYLNKHIPIHSDERPFSCEVCKAAFKKPNTLRRHVCRVKPYSCHLCGRKYAETQQLDNHLKKYHKQRTDKPHQGAVLKKRNYDSTSRVCDICGKQFAKRHNLEEHQKTHTGEKPFNCEVCGKCFAHKSDFRIHERSHTGTLDFQCSVCHKVFYSAYRLRCHSESHSSEKNYKCEACGCAFAQSSSLRKHLRKRHTENGMENSASQKGTSGKKQGVRYMCEYCWKTFDDKYNLTRHRRSHTGEKPHVCKYCGRRFATSSNMYAHVRNHEKKQMFGKISMMKK